MNDIYSTRLKLENNTGLYPCLQIHWQREGICWRGRCQRWVDGDTKSGKEHTVTLCQSIPLGSITVVFDECKGGAWRTYNLEGSRIDERDLLWATAWAALAMETKLAVVPDEETRREQ